MERAAKLEVIDQMKRKRPLSAYGSKSVRSLKSYRSYKSSVALSRSGSFASSAITHVPDLDEVVLMSMAWEIHRLRTKIVQKAQ